MVENLGIPAGYTRELELRRRNLVQYLVDVIVSAIRCRCAFFVFEA
jgi:hypothetical protein